MENITETPVVEALAQTQLPRRVRLVTNRLPMHTKRTDVFLPGIREFARTYDDLATPGMRVRAHKLLTAYREICVANARPVPSSSVFSLLLMGIGYERVRTSRGQFYIGRIPDPPPPSEVDLVARLISLTESAEASLREASLRLAEIARILP